MWYLVLGALVIISLLFNLILTSFFGSPIGAYIVKPVIWISFAILVVLIAKKEELNIWNFKAIRRWGLGKSPFHASLLIGGFHVSLLIIAGLFAGFGKSPYSFTPLGILINVIFVASALFAIELRKLEIENAAFIEIFVYSVIILTVIIQGFTADPFSKLLGLKIDEENGWLIIGAHRLSRRIAKILEEYTGQKCFL